ncbi:protein kinase, partial [Oscillospiraceae bacterium DSM 107454]|nr:protein kinase [Ructibacterium gallinarum]
MGLCMGCMKEKGEAQVCPYCGLDEKELAQSTGAFLPPGTLLHDRYTVGIALGQGGFGITYIGFDNVLNTRVAIKEY